MNASLCSALAGAMLLALAPSASAARFVSDGRIRADGLTVLMACDAEHSPDLAEFQSGGHGKFHLKGWQKAGQQATWTIRADAADTYDVNVLLHRSGGGPVQVRVSVGDAAVVGVLSARGWQRVPLQGLLPLPAGPAQITLRLDAAETNGLFAAEVLAVELVRPAVRAELDREALAQRSDMAWMRKADYGFMVHWTSQSQPQKGDTKPYADAVRDFDVEGFANQMKAGGAGFVVFTTSHGFQYFPAPLAALDQILPGRTASRDLVADLAKALDARGLRLLLYYHLGAAQDRDWMAAAGFWDTDTSRFLGNWSRIVSQAGQRYGSRLAGWWFDDGATSYYYRSPDWRALTAAAKAGYAQRVVGYNPWVYPSPTPFQDYYCGEGNADPAGDGTLPPDGRGLLGPGPYAGLQACATLLTEGDWGCFTRGRATPAPRWNSAQLRAMIDAFARHGNVPVFNLEISQEGLVSERTLTEFRQARQLREGKGHE